MENILSFLADNYLYFMIGAVVLLFALIGFAVDGRMKKKDDRVEMNPANTMPNQGVQFGQNPTAAQTTVPNQVPPVQPELNNGMSTGSMGISDLLFLYHAGGASDDDFDKDFKEGIGTMMTNILEGINEAGFLGEIDTKAMEKQLKQDSSKTSGESNKA